MIKHEHKAVDGDIYWVAHNNDGKKAIAVCTQGYTVATGQPDFEWSYDVDELIKSVADLDFTDWREVPPQGEWVSARMYSYEGKLIVCYQEHYRTEHAIEDVPSLFGIYRGVLAEWVQPLGGHDAYNTGDEVMFDGSHYRSLIDANVWSPSVYAAGWEEII